MAKKQKIEVEIADISEIKQDDRNANKHSEAGDALLDKSINDLGLGRSVLVDVNNQLIAGNGVHRKAVEAGKTKTLIVDIDGDTLLVGRRNDMDLNDPGESGRKSRQMALIDNSSALLGIEFDIETVHEIEEQWGLDASEWGVAEIPEYENQDYSGKNKEIDTNDFEDKMKISLEYTMEEYHTVKAALQKIAATPEQAVWQLLGL
jgi:hypothetical protein